MERMNKCYGSNVCQIPFYFIFVTNITLFPRENEFQILNKQKNPLKMKFKHNKKSWEEIYS